MDRSDPQNILLGPGRGQSPRPSRRPRQDHSDQRICQCAIETARLCSDRHCQNVLLFDLRGLSDLTDYMLIASGTSNRQLKSIGAEVAHLADRQFGMVRLGSDIDETTTWLVYDFADLIVHLFDPAVRAHYDIEMMWDDAPRVEWRRGADREPKA